MAPWTGFISYIWPRTPVEPVKVDIIAKPSLKEGIGDLLYRLIPYAVSGLCLYAVSKAVLHALSINDESNERLEAERILKELGVDHVQEKLTSHELCVASNFVNPSTLHVSWSDIGGMDELINEIRYSVILPFLRPELLANSSLYRAPRGVLLYGPPGCGKTMIAQAIAKESRARFLDLKATVISNKWYGESQKRVQAIFTLAQKLQPVIIFIDEMDSILRTRQSTDHEVTSVMKTQFMTFWDGFSTLPDDRIMIIGATNKPTEIDDSIRRRMPVKFFIGLPNETQIEDIMKKILSSENVSDEVLHAVPEIAKDLLGRSGSDVKEICRSAVVHRIQMILKRNGYDMDMELSNEDMFIQLEDVSAALTQSSAVDSHLLSTV